MGGDTEERGGQTETDVSPGQRRDAPTAAIYDRGLSGNRGMVICSRAMGVSLCVLE